MKSIRSSLTLRRIADYCDLRLTPVLEPEEVSTVRECFVGLLGRDEHPPHRDSGLDLKVLTDQLGLSPLAAMWHGGRSHGFAASRASMVDVLATSVRGPRARGRRTDLFHRGVLCAMGMENARL